MKPTIQIHGHRGCRGYYPENTLEGFKQALRLGATAIELDVVVDKMGELVVSHEPYMNYLFCTQSNGERVIEKSQTDFNLFRMNIAEIQSFDCGSRIDTKYPQQIAVKEKKPSLEEVVLGLDNTVFFNIEVKSEQQWYGIYQPQPAEYAALVATFIDTYNLADRCLVQSFDVEFLNCFQAITGDSVTIGYLIEGELELETQLKMLHFKPHYLNPDYKILTVDKLADLKKMGIKTLVWTVNENQDIEKMIALEVDGIISDYPDRVVRSLLA